MDMYILARGEYRIQLIRTLRCILIAYAKQMGEGSVALPIQPSILKRNKNRLLVTFTGWLVN
jgi:hypothetical protein